MTIDESARTPRKVFLFSGHMIDAPGRPVPRFPASAEPAARRALERMLGELGLGDEDLAIHGGACGGDLLFGEIALARGAACEVYLPFDETKFLQTSVDFAGAAWHRRYLDAVARGTLHVLPDAGEREPDGLDAYSRNNGRMLSQACRFGAHRLEFVCLWDGGGGDGPGGTRHMREQVAALGGHTHWIDTTQL